MHQSALRIGPIPGVEVGDNFYYRVELMIVGLHRRPLAGIDSMEFGREKDRIATCIVANERHLDKMNDPNMLTYVGKEGISRPIKLAYLLIKSFRAEIPLCGTVWRRDYPSG